MYNILKEVDNGSILYNKNDVYVGKSIEHYGEYQSEELKLFEEYVHPGDVVLDIGANIGTHTLWFSERVGDNGFVLAFEPQRLVFQTLCANMAINSRQNVDCKHMGVGDKQEIVKVPPLNPDVENNFGGLWIDGHKEGEDVAICKIDDMGLNRLDFIKIDVEGMEPSVLLGGLQTINKLKPAIYMEVDREKNYELLNGIITGLSYNVQMHTPSLHPSDSEMENIFGDVVSLNALCLSRERKYNGTYN